MSTSPRRAVERFEAECRQLVKVRGLRLVRVLKDNNVRASRGNKGSGFAEVLRMVRAAETDYVVIPVVDRFFRSLRDLEDVIDICLETGAALVAASGEIDLSHDQGRLVARLLTSVAKVETERKGEWQRKANEQVARAGKRRTGGPRPFGWRPEYVADPHGDGGQRRVYVQDEAETDAIRWAADCLLGGGTISAVMREWERRGLRPPEAPFGPLRQNAWKRNGVTAIMRNPRLAGLSPLPARDGERHGEIIGRGDWDEILPEETWRAVDRVLAASDRTITYQSRGKTVTRNIKADTPRGVRTLLGGLAACRCGNTVQGSVSYQGNHVYRCNPETRVGREGPHVSVRAEPVNEFTEQVVLDVLSSGDLAALVSPPPHADTAALRKEAAAIRANLDSMAADRALGLVSRSQMLKATEKGNARLAAISAELAEAAGAGALAPFLDPDVAARKTWDALDLSRKREVIRALGSITLLPAGKGARAYDLRKVLFVSPAGEDLTAGVLRQLGTAAAG